MVEKKRQVKHNLQCPVCGKTGFSAQGLSGHLRFKHNKRLPTKAGGLSAPIARFEKGGKMTTGFHCQYCNWVGADFFSLLHHMNRNHLRSKPNGSQEFR